MVKNAQIIRSALLMSAGAAMVMLAACGKSGSSENGAYVAGGADASQPAVNQPLPPSNEYQAVANRPPPPLPVYDQPPIPAPGYIWTPGYWGWNDAADDYYWAPGAWIEPPHAGYLWTPGYWRFYNGRYLFSDGYWGPQVGFYGGVDYGYGYDGSGYGGGRWQGDRFYYNSQANNFGGRRIDATYRQDLATHDNRVSFNGGPGGLHAAPAKDEIAAAQARHAPPTSGQREQARMASAEPQLRASVNRGSPPIAATSRPAQFHAAAGVTAARSAPTYQPPAKQAPAGEERQATSGSGMGRPGAANRPAPMAAGERANERTGFAAPAPRPAAVRAPQEIRQAAAERVAPPFHAPTPERAPPQFHAPAPMRAAPEMHAPQMQAPQMHAAPAAPHPAAPPAHGPEEHKG
jgi:hypothetical protein